MEEKYRIAIVVPIYNTSKYLHKCIDSLLSQTYKNFKIFAINDGSSDNCSEILEQYKKDERIDVFNTPNLGVAVARNFALDAIEKENSFDYVSFVDSDDKVTKDFLECLVNTAIKYQSDISICFYQQFHENEVQNIDNLELESKNLSKDEFTKLIFSKDPNVRTQCSGGMIWKELFKTSLIKGIRFIENRNFVHDEIFCLQAAVKAQKIQLIPKVLYWYRQRSNSLIQANSIHQRLINGRMLCIDVAKQISKYAENVAISAFITHVVFMLKNGKQLSNIDLSIYRDRVIVAKENNFISSHTFKYFIRHCDHPTLSRIYYRIKDLIKLKR